MRVLEVGPDGVPSSLRCQLGGLALDWQTAELDPTLMPAGGVCRSPTSHTTYRMRTAYEVPTPNDTFDIALAAIAIEDVQSTWRWVPEIARITKPGGKAIIINPLSFPYHTAPYDCWRIYPDGMQALCAEPGLEVVFSRCEALERGTVKPTVSRSIL